MMADFVSNGTPTWVEDVEGNVGIETRGGAKEALVTIDNNGVLKAKGQVIGGGGVQVPSDWNATGGVNQILNKPTVLNLEQIQDAVAAMFGGAHSGATMAYDDAAGTLTITVAGGGGGGGTTAEEVQDFLNTALAHANHVGVTVAYDDANNRFVITSTGGGSGDSALSRKVNVTIGGVTVTVIISGFGTSAALNAITVTPSFAAPNTIITLANTGTFKVRSVAVNLPGEANAGTGFTVVAPDPSGATVLADSALASMAIYNDSGATVAATLVTVGLAGGNLSVNKASLSTAVAYRFKVLF